MESFQIVVCRTIYLFGIAAMGAFGLFRLPLPQGFKKLLPYKAAAIRIHMYLFYF